MEKTKENFKKPKEFIRREVSDIIQKKEYSSWLIPILCLLVIFQTVVLISEKNIQKKEEVAIPFIPLPTITEVKEASSKLKFIPSGVTLQKGESTTIDLVLTPKRSFSLDGADIVLKYDPKIVEVTKVTFPKLFSFTSPDRGSLEKGIIYYTFLEEKAGGLPVRGEIKLLSLNIKAKAKGESEISIVTQDEGITTVLAENGTSKKISFDQGVLKVVVY